jgi:hypothetical protein
MSGQQRKVIQRKSRARKEKTEETSIHRRPRARTEAAPAELEKVDERMSEILGERQTHQVISDTRLWDDNRQQGGQ